MVHCLQYTLVPQGCHTRVSHKSDKQECPTRVPRKSVPQECQECPTRVPRKSVLQAKSLTHKSVLQECSARVSYKSVPQEWSVICECPTRESYKSVPQECPTRVCDKSVPRDCPTRVCDKSPTRVSYKTVPQECPQVSARVSFKSAPPDIPTRVSDKSIPYRSVPQECATRVSYESVRLQYERFVRDFLLIQALRTRLPQKFTLRVCKTSVLCKTSSKSHASRVPIGAHTSSSPAKQFRDSSPPNQRPPTRQSQCQRYSPPPQLATSDSLRQPRKFTCPHV